MVNRPLHPEVARYELARQAERYARKFLDAHPGHVCYDYASGACVDGAGKRWRYWRCECDAIHRLEAYIG